MYNQYTSPLGYQTGGSDMIDTYGVNHSGFSISDELTYQTAREKRENELIKQLNSLGITQNFPQYSTNFWGNPANNYGFGTANIADIHHPLNKNLNNGVQYAQNNLPQLVDCQNLTKPIDYSLYGDGFSKEFIDKMENDMEFQKILNEYIIPNEGGYVNRLNDRGKETNYGISQKTYYHEDIPNLTRERANAIIYRDFYDWNGINKLPYSVRGFVVDYGMPTSPLNAIQTVHKVLNLPPNGNIVGPITMKKFNNFSEDDYVNFLNNYKEEMYKYYHDLVEKDPTQKENLSGWLNRANRAHLAK